MSSERRNDPARLRPFKQALSTTTQILAHDKSLRISFGDERPGLHKGTAYLPDLIHMGSGDEIAVLRGHADSCALMHRYHDAALYQRLRPSENAARPFFHFAEHLRAEALGARDMPGMASNLSAKLAADYRFRSSRLVMDQTDTPLVLALRMIAGEAIAGLSPPPEAEDLLSEWRPRIMERAAPIFEELRARLEDQIAYASRVYDLLHALGIAKQTFDEDVLRARLNDNRDEFDPRTQVQSSPGVEEVRIEAGDEDNGTDDPDKLTVARAVPEPLSRRDEPDRRPSDEDLARFEYIAFTTSNDETTPAEDLADPDETDRLRAELDLHLNALHRTPMQFANKLQRRLMAQQSRRWEFDLEEGMLDAARLPRVVTDPMQPLSFKRESVSDFKDTIVTLLIDNSGSMKGEPIQTAACCADLIANALIRCDVKVEILGFTTRDWKGGRSRQQWLATGRRPAPGRVSDLRHIIYKAADAPWRRSRRNLGIMLRPGLLKENVDGEALAWAHERLARRPERRRILMVISDGAPADDATITANSREILDWHLRKVIQDIEQRSSVELVAVGIGHDVTRYYRNAVMISGVDDLAGAMTDNLANLFGTQLDMAAVARSQRQVAGPAAAS